MTEPATRAVQGGTEPDPAHGALVPPIHASTTYAQQAPRRHSGFTYSRSSNPTVLALEQRLASIAGGIGTLAFGSGMAAIDTLLRAVLDPGDEVLVSDVVYGGTERLLRERYAPAGHPPRFVDASRPETLEDPLAEAGVLLIETPANPTLALADLEGCIERAHAAGVPVAVDNTFLTPLGQRALELGADVSLHSTTKYLEGHGCAVGGAIVVGSDPDLYIEAQSVRKTTGTIASPFAAWLTLRGIETLPLRLERVSRTATHLAAVLAEHPAIAHVAYPGHAGHPQHELARRQHEHHGGLVAFSLAGGRPAVDRFLDSLETITLAEHLGTSRTLVTHPATMTHASVPDERREALSIGEGLLRLSVGLEAPEDLAADLEQALDAAQEAPNVA